VAPRCERERFSEQRKEDSSLHCQTYLQSVSTKTRGGEGDAIESENYYGYRAQWMWPGSEAKPAEVNGELKVFFHSDLEQRYTQLNCLH
jgi:hypothetical protein